MLSKNLGNNKEWKENKKKSKEDTKEGEDKNNKKLESDINIEDLTDAEMNLMVYIKKQENMIKDHFQYIIYHY